jgi:ElaA protein
MADAAASEFAGEWLTFDEMDGRTVHELLRLRQDIFVVEQESAYADIDGKDPEALHLLLRSKQTGELAGALRFFPPHGPDQDMRIGRVVIAEGFRGKGLGRILMNDGLEKARAFGSAAIHLTGQAHLERFYGELGFETVSDVYLQDGIPHIDMLRSR